MGDGEVMAEGSGKPPRNVQHADKRSQPSEAMRAAFLSGVGGLVFGAPEGGPDSEHSPQEEGPTDKSF